MSRKPSAGSVYLLIEGGYGFSFALLATISSVFLVVDAGLEEFQLMLVGTVLEGTVFLSEVPTGVLADAVSRRTSVIVGHFLMGAGFLLYGATTDIGTILAGQVVWGIGVTFISGAEQAWITDEVGEERARVLYLTGSQVANVGALAGIATSAVIAASFTFNLPMLLSGVLFVAMGLVLLVVMPERRFIRPRNEIGRSRPSPVPTLRNSLHTVRGRPILVLILGVAAFHGLSTEAFDRLANFHLIKDAGIPQLAGLPYVLWFGVIGAMGLILSIAAAQVVKRKADISSHAGAARTLALIDVLLIVGVVAFGALTAFGPLLLCLWAVDLLRSVREPVYTAWINQGLDPRSRATINSAGSQMDAIGQVAGGPAVGAFAALRSAQAAIVLAGVLRAPALALFYRAIRTGTAGTLPPEQIRAADVAAEMEPAEINVAGMADPDPHASGDGLR